MIKQETVCSGSDIIIVSIEGRLLRLEVHIRTMIFRGNGDVRQRELAPSGSGRGRSDRARNKAGKMATDSWPVV